MCLLQKRVVPFEAAKIVGPYRGILKEIIHLFKYRGKMGLGISLIKFMADQLSQKFADLSFDSILSVPLHKKKLREREFDQSQTLAENLNRKVRIPLEAENLVRIRWTESQAGLNRKERIKNVRGAFTLKKSFSDQRATDTIGWRCVYYRDHYHRMCRSAKRRGAARIHIFTLAKA